MAHLRCITHRTVLLSTTHCTLHWTASVSVHCTYNTLFHANQLKWLMWRLFQELRVPRGNISFWTMVMMASFCVHHKGGFLDVDVDDTTSKQCRNIQCIKWNISCTNYCTKVFNIIVQESLLLQDASLLKVDYSLKRWRWWWRWWWW